MISGILVLIGNTRICRIGCTHLAVIVIPITVSAAWNECAINCHSVMLPQSESCELHDNSWFHILSLCQSIKIKKTIMYIARALTQVLKLTPVHFMRVVSCPVPPLVSWGQSLWCGTNALNNWKLTMLHQLERCSITAWCTTINRLLSFLSYMCFPVPENQNYEYVWQVINPRLQSDLG